MYRNWPKEKKKKKKKTQNTLNSDFHSNKQSREPTDGVDSLKTRNQQSRGAAMHLYSLSTD